MTACLGADPQNVMQLHCPRNIGGRFGDLLQFGTGYIGNGCFLKVSNLFGFHSSIHRFCSENIPATKIVWSKDWHFFKTADVEDNDM